MGEVTATACFAGSKPTCRLRLRHSCGHSTCSRCACNCLKGHLTMLSATYHIQSKLDCISLMADKPGLAAPADHTILWFTPVIFALIPALQLRATSQMGEKTFHECTFGGAAVDSQSRAFHGSYSPSSRLLSGAGMGEVRDHFEDGRARCSNLWSGLHRRHRLPLRLVGGIFQQMRRSAFPLPQVLDP